METENIKAELSSLTSNIEEVLTRLVNIADEYRGSEETIFTSECNQAERSLQSTMRSLRRAQKEAP
jgi:ElaB/YqjD/DUF883 family membrane-anchored ribosome-binding protein